MRCVRYWDNGSNAGGIKWIVFNLIFYIDGLENLLLCVKEKKKSEKSDTFMHYLLLVSEMSSMLSKLIIL